MSTGATSGEETGRHIAVLDAWRGLSIAFVLVGHFFPLKSMPWLAEWGVEWFFVLSGRLMAEILFVRRTPLKEFYRRRVSRVLPVLLVFVPTMFVVFRGTHWGFKPTAGLAAMTFTLNYASIVIGHQVQVIAHIWSLCIEEHTYILLAGLAFLSRTKGWPVLPTLAAASTLSVLDLIVSAALYHKLFFDVDWRTDAHIFSILFGSIAYLALRGRDFPRWVPLGALGLSFVALFILGMTDQRVFLPISTAGLAYCVATLERGPLAVAINFKPIRALGLLSYSIYVWQQPFYWLSVFEGPMIRGAYLSASILAAVLSFFLIEQPARRWLNRRPMPQLATGFVQWTMSASRATGIRPRRLK